MRTLSNIVVNLLDVSQLKIRRKKTPRDKIATTTQHTPVQHFADFCCYFCIRKTHIQFFLNLHKSLTLRIAWCDIGKESVS